MSTHVLVQLFSLNRAPFEALLPGSSCLVRQSPQRTGISLLFHPDHGSFPDVPRAVADTLRKILEAHGADSSSRATGVPPVAIEEAFAGDQRDLGDAVMLRSSPTSPQPATHDAPADYAIVVKNAALQAVEARENLPDHAESNGDGSLNYNPEAYQLDG